MARNTAFNLGLMLKKEKLAATGNNYADWVCNLRIVLRSAKRMYVLESPLPAKPAATAPEDEQNVWATKDDDHNLVQCLMSVSVGRTFTDCFFNLIVSVEK